MVKPAKISSAFRRKHQGKAAISLNGKVIAVGKNAVAALQLAKKKNPSIEEEDFVISKIHYKHIAV